MSLNHLTFPGSVNQPASYDPLQGDLSCLWPELHQACLQAARQTSTQLPSNLFNQTITPRGPSLDFPSNTPTAWGFQNLLGIEGPPSSSPPYPSGAPGRAAHFPTFELSPPSVNASYHQPEAQSSRSSSDLSNIQVSGSKEFSPGRLDADRQRRRSSTLSFPNSRSPGYKMFKCTLDPHCEMEFTRAEHLARHERKHTKEKPFKCHCSKSFSRLDNWRQHKISVHKSDVAENAKTEERLIKVHKDMQRDNNIRKAVTIAARQQGRLEMSPSGSELCPTTLLSPYSSKDISSDGGSRPQSDLDFMFPLSPHPPTQLGTAIMLFSGSAPVQNPEKRYDFATHPSGYSPMALADLFNPNGPLSPFPATQYMPGLPALPQPTNQPYASPSLYAMMTPSSGTTSSQASTSPQSQPTYTAAPPDQFITLSTPQRSTASQAVHSEQRAQGTVRKRELAIPDDYNLLMNSHKRFKGSV